MRRVPWVFAVAIAIGLGVSLSVACGSDPLPANPLPVTAAPDSGQLIEPPFDSGGPVDPDAGGDVPDGADPLLPDGGKPPGRVYANTATTLYRFDPLANTLVVVGLFDCVPHGGVGSTDDSVLDIALDRTGQMYGTTFYRFIQIDAATGACTVIKTQDTPNLYPNSLSFVPLGTVDNTKEALLGYGYDGAGDARIYTRIDLETGEPTTMEDMNPTPLLNGVEYGLAGDFISLARAANKTYGTVTQLTGDAGTTNLLGELDPTTGTVLRIVGDVGQANLFGMGYWGGKAYGFSSSGAIYAIDVTTGQSTLVTPTMTTDAGPISWFGAGVTTDSPTAP